MILDEIEEIHRIEERVERRGDKIEEERKRELRGEDVDWLKRVRVFI